MEKGSIVSDVEYRIRTETFKDQSFNRSTNLPKEQIAQNIISDLSGLQDKFLFCENLKSGYYKIDINFNQISIKFFNLKDKQRIDIILNYVVNQIENGLEVTLNNKIEEIISPKFLKESGAKSSGIIHFINNWNFNSNIIIDKEIINFSSNANYGKVFNKNYCSNYLHDINNNPSHIFLDATDAIILPHYFDPLNGLITTVDKQWSRFVEFDETLRGNINSYGHLGNTNSWEFIQPTGIDYGTYTNSQDGCYIYQNYPVFIADIASNKIVKFNYSIGYCANNGNGSSYSMLDPKDWSVLLNNLHSPYDLAIHKGTNLINSNDDLLWFSENRGSNGSNNGDLICVNSVTGNEVQRITQINFGNGLENIYPSRIAVYRSPGGEKNILAFIDQNKNVIIFCRLNNNGTLNYDYYNNFVFDIVGFGSNLKLTSIILNSQNNGLLGETTVWAAADGGPGGCSGGQHCGSLSTLKVIYAGNEPYNVDYLSSCWGGNNSNTNFVDLQNLYMQNGYNDIFTIEKWSDDFGIRRYKNGVQILAESQNGIYCTNTGYNYTVKLTNPAKCTFNAKWWDGCANTWTNIPINDINGVGIINYQGTAYLNSGYNYVTIKVTLPTNYLNSACAHKLKFETFIIPEDESDFSSANPHRLYRAYEAGISDCVVNPGGCPFVYVNDGKDFKQDNNILHRSEFQENEGVDILDKYKLNVIPVAVDGNFELKIKELNADYDHFDNFRLKAYDHPVGTQLAITENKDVVIFFPSYVSSPTDANLDGVDVTKIVAYDSTSSEEISGDEDSDLISTFEDAKNKRMTFAKVKDAYLTCLRAVMNNVSLSKQGKNKEKTYSNNIIDSTALILDPSADAYHTAPIFKTDAAIISAFDTELGYIAGDKKIARRENSSIVVLPVGRNINVDSVSADWNRDFKLSYFAATDVFYGGYIQYELELNEVESSYLGDVTKKLKKIEEDYVDMDSTSEIILRFANDLPEVEPGFVREYVLETKGRYSADGGLNRTETSAATDQNNIPHEYRLYQNYPNPFNPTTTIKYDIPKDGLVSIKIYDMLGKEVYKFEQYKQAGFYEMQYNGSKLASGIYFYRIEAKDFVNTKRMVLIK